MGAATKIPVPIPEQEAPKRERPQLRLVNGGPETAPPPEQKAPAKEVNLPVLLGVFVSCVAAVAALLMYTATPGETLPKRFAAFQSLHEVFATNGIDAFLAAKQTLRGEVEKTLAEKGSASERRAAVNLAALLFPELLADDDFEKNDAISGWARLERAIEEAPRSTESRLWFEELRATLWNYENADRQNPRLTPWGKQVLKIYDVMTTP